MFHFLFFYSSSTFWNFSHSELPKIINNSINVPLFVLCYSEFCVHCHGLPSAFREFSKLHNSNDLIISMVDCDKDKKGCSIFHAEGTPKMSLVIGSDYRYWFQTKKRKPSDWENWIDLLKVPYILVHKEEEVIDIVKRLNGNGSVFYLEIQSNYHNWDEYINKFRFINRFNSILTLKTNNLLSKPSLRVYQNEYCYKEFKSNDLKKLEKFIDENKFGVLHNYYDDELEKLVKERNALIYVSERPLNEYRNESFLNINKIYCNSNYTFGWTSVLDNQQVLKVLNYTLIDVPFLYGINQKSKYHNIYKLKIEDKKLKQFIEQLEYSNTTKDSKISSIFIYFLISFINLIIVIIFPLSKKTDPKLE